SLETCSGPEHASLVEVSANKHESYRQPAQKTARHRNCRMAACIEGRGIAFHIEPRSHHLFEAGTGGRERGSPKKGCPHGQHVANLERLIIGGAKHAAQVLRFGVVPTLIILPHECREQERELADGRQLIGSLRPRLAPVLQQCCRIIAFEAKAHGVPTIEELSGAFHDCCRAHMITVDVPGNGYLLENRPGLRDLSERSANDRIAVGIALGPSKALAENADAQTRDGLGGASPIVLHHNVALAWV